METLREERSVYELFRISVLLKGLISVVEVVSGIAILFITPAMVQGLAGLIAGGELSHEPYDFFARHLLALASQYTTHAAHFLAVYFFSRGIVKVFLIWALLKNKLWAYPASIVVLMLFVVYQLWQIWTEHSLLVVGITVFDLIVVYFIWREWQIVKRHHGQNPAAA